MTLRDPHRRALRPGVLATDNDSVARTISTLRFETLERSSIERRDSARLSPGAYRFRQSAGGRYQGIMSVQLIIGWHTKVLGEHKSALRVSLQRLAWNCNITRGALRGGYWRIRKWTDDDSGQYKSKQGDQGRMQGEEIGGMANWGVTPLGVARNRFILHQEAVRRVNVLCRRRLIPEGGNTAV